MRRTILIGLAMMWAICVRGDVVVLNNGKRIEGRIVKNDSQEVEVAVGEGSVSFPKSIVKIIRVTKESAKVRKDRRMEAEESLTGQEKAALGEYRIAREYRERVLETWAEWKAASENLPWLVNEGDSAELAIGGAQDERDAWGESRKIYAVSTDGRRMEVGEDRGNPRHVTTSILASADGGAPRITTTMSPYYDDLARMGDIDEEFRKINRIKSELKRRSKTYAEKVMQFRRTLSDRERISKSSRPGATRNEFDIWGKRKLKELLGDFDVYRVPAFNDPSTGRYSFEAKVNGRFPVRFYATGARDWGVSYDVAERLGGEPARVLNEIRRKKDSKDGVYNLVPLTLDFGPFEVTAPMRILDLESGGQFGSGLDQAFDYVSVEYEALFLLNLKPLVE